MRYFSNLPYVERTSKGTTRTCRHTRAHTYTNAYVKENRVTTRAGIRDTSALSVVAEDRN